MSETDVKNRRTSNISNGSITKMDAERKEPTPKEKFANTMKFVYNKENGLFLGRNSKAWLGASICYSLFFMLLGLFISLLLFVFFQFVDPKVPTYYNEESVMNWGGVTPGMGFRPQHDIEDMLLKVNLSEPESKKAYVKSLGLFLEKYEKNEEYQGEDNKIQKFDLNTVLEGSPCSKSANYGLDKNTLCVVVKLNRVFGWMPEVAKPSSETETQTGENTETDDDTKKDRKRDTGNESGGDQFIHVKCNGQHSNDKDNIGEIDYYSEYPSNEMGGISFKYFPYKNQDNYLSPLVFVHLKSLPNDVLINVLCKAYAGNIENTDVINMRGMVKFQVYIGK